MDFDVYQVSALLADVSNMAWRGGFWPRLRDNIGMSLEVLKQMLAAITLDQMVKRIKPIMLKCQAHKATWGSQEEVGVIMLHLQVRQQEYVLDLASLL